MKLLPAYAVGISGVGDYNSVSSGPDDGANSNMRQLFWQSMGHATTTQATNNFLSRLNAVHDGSPQPLGNAGELNLCGHGNEGFLETGAGQHGTQDYLTNVMMFWSSRVWGPDVARLAPKNFPTLYIWSCHTGAGDRGADFLFEFAKRVKHPVAGRTGFTYSNVKKGVWFEAGSVWQVATPDVRPAPIPAPTPHLREVLMASVSVVDEGNVVALEEADILEVSVIRRGLLGARRAQTATVVPREAAFALIDAACASEAYALPGEPAAMITAIVVVRFRGKSGERSKTFTIYNDRLAVDRDEQVAYYSRNDVSLLLDAV